MEIAPGRLIVITITVVAGIMLSFVAGRVTSDSAEEVSNADILYQYIDSHTACQAVGGRSSKAAADATYAAAKADGSDFMSCHPPA